MKKFLSILVCFLTASVAGTGALANQIEAPQSTPELQPPGYEVIVRDRINYFRSSAEALTCDPAFYGLPDGDAGAWTAEVVSYKVERNFRPCGPMRHCSVYRHEIRCSFSRPSPVGNPVGETQDDANVEGATPLLP